MEHIIHSHVISHLTKDGTLNPAQHGFRKNRSCETQLIETVNELAKSLNQKQQIDSILLDFSKAFDKICHRKLLLKLNHYGINRKVLNWIGDFLSKRTQRVVVRGVSYEPSSVSSGVPQGTVLGPLVFLVYINDMPLNVSSKIGLFADDACLYRSIKTEEDISILQNDLNALVSWENDWSMEFNPSKCNLLRITNKKKIIEGDYTIRGQQLKSVDKAKYLGVTIHKNLN